MDALYPVYLAALIAGLLIYFDLDTVFDTPPSLSWGPWAKLLLAWWGFVLSNAVLAGTLYFILKETAYFKDVNVWLAAMSVGFGYPAFVRLKFTTLPINGKATPIGVDTFYEGLKSLVHKRINRIIRQWRMEQTAILAQLPIADLRGKCKASVMGDVLMSDDQRKSANDWIEQVVSSETVVAADRPLLLATYILTGQMRAG